jgi:hypothetical protein
VFKRATFPAKDQPLVFITDLLFDFAGNAISPPSLT